MNGSVTQLDHLHDGLVLVDEILAKVVLADELALAARKEGLLREYVNAQWNQLAARAAQRAASMIRAGKGEVTDTELDRIMREVSDIMGGWDNVVGKRFTDDMEDIYGLAQLAAVRRATGYGRRPTVFNTDPFLSGVTKATRAKPSGKPPRIDLSFDQVDKEALESFKKHQLFWIGNHWQQNVSDHVANTARDELVALGRGRVAAGRAMQGIFNKALKEVNVPDGFQGSSKQYFEGLVANAATVQRVHSQLNTFHRAGFEKYVIVNPNDHRTCETCNLMDGKEFYVSDGRSLATKLRNSTSPIRVKALQPFMSVKDARRLTGGKAGPAGVERTRGMAAHNPMPPFHYRCRCNIDIVDSEPLAPPAVATALPKDPVPKTFVRPTINREALDKDLKNLRLTWNSNYLKYLKTGKASDFKAARKHVEGMLEQHWGITQFGATRKKQAAKGVMLEARGTTNNNGWRNAYSGRMALREDIAAGVGKALDNAYDGVWRRRGHSGWKGLRTLVHESIHGANRDRHSAYVGAGKALIEVQTEVAARKVVRDIFGKTRSTRHTGTSLDLWAPLGDSVDGYGPAVVRTLEIVKESTGWSRDKVASAVEEAALCFNSDKHKTAVTTANTMIKRFISDINDAETLPRGAKKKLEKALADLRIRWSY